MSSNEFLRGTNKEQRFQAINGMFNLLNELQIKGTPEEAVIAETGLADLFYQVAENYSFDGLSGLAGECYLKGIIPNRGVIYRIVADKYTEVDQLRKGEQQSLHYPIIGVVGRIAAGKGTIGETLEKMYDSFHFPFSDRLREVAVGNGILPPFSRDELRQVDAKIKPVFGKETFIRWTLETAERIARNLHMPQVVSVDGFRSIEETQWFLSQPRTTLVAVTTDDNLRYQRSLGRARPSEDPFTKEEFQKNDRIEREWIDPIMKMTSHTFHNNSTLDEFQKEVKTYFNSLI